MGEIWKFYEFLIWSTSLKDCITAPSVLSWGFQNIFHVVPYIKTIILSTQSAPKSTWALWESFRRFPDLSAKLIIFKIFLKINITLVYFVQFRWSLTLNGGYWCQEIDWWGSHVPLMCSSHVKHVFLHIKLLKWTPKIACRSMFSPIVPPETHTDSTGKVQ